MFKPMHLAAYLLTALAIGSVTLLSPMRRLGHGVATISLPTTGAADPQTNDARETSRLPELAGSDPNAPNILVIIADDYTPLYFAKNHELARNQQRLARRGTQFLRAYSNYPVCGPSRQSFMSGRMADSTKIWNFERWLPQTSTQLLTIGKYFMDVLGYDSWAFGKVYHDAENYGKEELGQLWFRNGHWSHRNMLQDKSGDVQCNSHWSCTLPETTLVDYISERAASAWLRAREQLVPAKPFLLFVGFRRPHLDMAAPPATLKQVPKNAPLPDLSEPVVTGRSGAAVPFRQSLSRFECYDEIVGRHVGRLPMSPISRFAQMNGTLHSMRQGYFAAASWMDSRLGKLLDTLDSTRFQNDTAVVFFSDHGFAVGEHGIFCKNALFEQQTRVAMIVAPPRRDFVRASSRLDPVDLVDVFPTLIHIATGRRPAVAAAVDESGLVLDGKSLYAFDSQQSAFAFSQYSRCENTSYHAMCTIQRSPCGRVAATFMGYAVRTAAARYVEWRPFQESRTGCFKATWQGEDAYLHTQMPAVWQIDPAKTGTIWAAGVEQREMYVDYVDNEDSLAWERENVLQRGQLQDLRSALELSATIRWRFDPDFAPGGPRAPCSGRGFLRLVQPDKWLDWTAQPQVQDVACECLGAFSGAQCETGG